jgi:hypothetical protein
MISLLGAEKGREKERVFKVAKERGIVFIAHLYLLILAWE